MSLQMSAATHSKLILNLRYWLQIHRSVRLCRYSDDNIDPFILKALFVDKHLRNCPAPAENGRSRLFGCGSSAR